MPNSLPCGACGARAQLPLGIQQLNSNICIQKEKPLGRLLAEAFKLQFLWDRHSRLLQGYVVSLTTTNPSHPVPLHEKALSI